MPTKRLDPLDNSDDITTPYNNMQTGNNCPDCGKEWLDDKPTPGVLHRTRLCSECKNADDKYFKSGTRYPGQ